MKKLTIKKITMIFLSFMFIIAPFSAIATDRWNETPDFHHETEVDSVTTGSARFNYMAPDIDMWTETPDLSADGEDHGVIIDSAQRLVDHFDPTMYAETPELS